MNINDIDKWIDEMTDNVTESKTKLRKEKFRRKKTPSRIQELEIRKAKQTGRVSRAIMVGVSADINRRTGELHEHKREKERNVSNGRFVSTKNS